jgi:hypothetical protein
MIKRKLLKISLKQWVAKVQAKEQQLVVNLAVLFPDQLLSRQQSQQ